MGSILYTYFPIPANELRYNLFNLLSLFWKKNKDYEITLLCVFVSAPVVARQRLGKHVPATINAHAVIELLYTVFSMQSVSYQISKILKNRIERNVGDQFFSELLVSCYNTTETSYNFKSNWDNGQCPT
jgi:hypothetical protein